MHIPSTTLVLMLTDVESAGHYRTTFTAAAVAPVYVMCSTPLQQSCVHPWAINPGRFGDAECEVCEALLWSLRWLAVGVFGPNTVTYGATEVETLHEAMRMSGIIVLNTMERQILSSMGLEQEEKEKVPTPITDALASGLGLVTEEQVDEVMKRIGPMPTPRIEAPTEVVAADLNPDQPARTRRGVPVPHMDLIDADWHPEPVA